VVLAYGAACDQKLDIPGEDLPGSHAEEDRRLNFWWTHMSLEQTRERVVAWSTNLLEPATELDLRPAAHADLRWVADEQWHPQQPKASQR